MSDLTPGTLVAVTTGALVRRWGSESEHYTVSVCFGMIIQKSHQVRESNLNWDAMEPDYLVLFSSDSRMYLVPQDHLTHPDHVKDPGRLFGRLSG